MNLDRQYPTCPFSSPQGNPEGQTTLASTILPLPSGVGKASGGEDEEHASFGSILVRALVASRGQTDLEASCRAAGVLLHILKDNRSCKERVRRCAKLEP